MIPASVKPNRKFTTRDRRVLFLMALVAFVAGYGGSALSHTLPFARESLGLSEGAMSTVFAITRAASLFALVFAMRADWYGRRLPFIAAFSLLPLANLLTALLPGAPLFAITQSVTRVSVIAVAALAIVFLSEELTPSVRGYGIGIYGLAGSMGTGFGLILLPIADRSDNAWRIIFGLTALGLLVVPLLNRFLVESRAFVRHETKIPFRRALQAGLGKHFWPLAGVAFFVAAFASPAFDFVLERLINDLEWDTGAARFLLIVFSGIGTIGLLVGGRMADSTGRRTTTVTALVLGLIGGVAFYTFDSGWLLAPSIFLATFGATMLTPSFAAHRSELFPTRVRATAGAWVTNVAILGSILGFVIGGVAIDRIGLPQTISILGLGLVVSIFLVLMLPETRGIDLVRLPADRAGSTTPSSRDGRPSGPQSPTRSRQGPSPAGPPTASPPQR